MLASILLATAGIPVIASAQSNPVREKRGEIWYDTVKYGPEIELVHLYYDEFPTGVAVSKTGRKFSNYPPGLDANNTNNGSNGKYTIAELLPNNTERAWPSAEMNNPPGGAINYMTFPPSGANYQNYIIGSQSIVIDSADRAWILDTGRALTPNGTLVPASYGGPKLIGVDLTNDQVFQTVVFPTTVAYADSYLNDVRFDLRPEITGSGKGVAYITDSSSEGRTGIITVDLGTGDSWRHLDGHPSVRPEAQFLPFVWGLPLYAQSGGTLTFQNAGSDGIALSSDFETLFYKPFGGRHLYSIPTSRLRDRSPTSELLAQASINNLGETGFTDGMETDTNGYIYHGNLEVNASGFYNPANGTDSIFVRDERINWVDTFSVSEDGWMYFTNNQLVFGEAKRRPFSLWRVKLPDGGRKIGVDYGNVNGE
ncbi:hypothetical protein HII31_03599 [Pseudocercospora fuligena]|uniref:Major royal jelly protein n=1 Tax=Pseudocercospora fuligena TaxID=685502 RepID=A0A8H6RQ70_9PEZI|nr:hypothetical protein HII31_03599 [Pseudocercospora fuligena]